MNGETKNKRCWKTSDHIFNKYLMKYAFYISVNVDNVTTFLKWYFCRQIIFIAVSELDDYLNYYGVESQQCAKMPNIWWLVRK